MYKIIGSDGREYGPCSAEQLRQWIAEGRANWQTLAQAVGATGWKPLGSFPEFGAPAAPTIAAAPSSPPPLQSTAPPATNGMAVAGFVLGFLGLLCCGHLFSTLGIVFSCIALSQIKHDPLRHTGRGLAQAGLILSILGLLMLLGGLLFWTRGILGRHPMFWHRYRQF